MKKLLMISFLFFVFFAACQEESSPVAPLSNNNNLEWVSMPQGLTFEHGLKTETPFNSSKEIEGKKGGDVKLKVELLTPDGEEFRIKAKLKVPKHAFDDNTTLNFNVTIDPNNTITSFAPHPYNFDVPLEYEIEYKGLDVSSMTLENLGFAYIAGDGTLQFAEYDKIEIDYGKKKIKVKKARIPHFSRFGFVKVKD